jgi:hypothetical protein
MESFKELNMTQAELVTLLKQHVLEITFTKVNGEQRVMPCTLREDRLPPREPVLEGSVSNRRPGPSGNVSVYCTDKNEWRSFRFENLKTWRIIE